MYKIEYLPVALNDMVGIVSYISKELDNPTAANHLAIELVNAVENLKDHPYANVAYYPLKSLKHEYRKMLVAKYIVFYWVDEATKVITIARVLYSKRDYQKILD